MSKSNTLTPCLLGTDSLFPWQQHETFCRLADKRHKPTNRRKEYKHLLPPWAKLYTAFNTVFTHAEGSAVSLTLNNEYGNFCASPPRLGGMPASFTWSSTQKAHGFDGLSDGTPKIELNPLSGTARPSAIALPIVCHTNYFPYRNGGTWFLQRHMLTLHETKLSIQNDTPHFHVLRTQWHWLYFLVSLLQFTTHPDRLSAMGYPQVSIQEISTAITPLKPFFIHP